MKFRYAVCFALLMSSLHAATLVENGVAKGVVVVREPMLPAEQMALEELNRSVERASGVKLPVVGGVRKL